MREIEFTIEPFQFSHQPSINALSKEIQKEFFIPFSSAGAKTIYELSLDPKQQYWCAISHGKVIGTIGIIDIGNASGVVKRMFLKKGFRGEKYNISKKLLQLVIYYGIEHNMKQLYLGTMLQFAAAQKFYLKNGFVEVAKEELPSNFPANDQDTIFYRLDL